jgi:hypothetical protein
MNILPMQELDPTILLLANPQPSHYTDYAKGGQTPGFSDLL